MTFIIISLVAHFVDSDSFLLLFNCNLIPCNGLNSFMMEHSGISDE